MIRDGAPAEWTPLMRDVAKEIADSARDPDPDGPPLPEGQWPWSPLHVEGYWDKRGTWHDGLAEICGATPRAISDALTRLARWGYEMRQPVTDREGNPVIDKRGRVVYAANGHAVSFWVPPLTPRPQPERSHQSATNPPERLHPNASNDGESSHQDATKDAGRSHSGASNTTERSHPGVPKVAPQCDPISSVSPQSLSPQKIQSPQPPLLAAVADVEAHPVAAGDEMNVDSDGPRQCGYAQCQIRAPVPVGRTMHESCRRFSTMKAQAARPPSPAVPLERQQPKAS